MLIKFQSEHSGDFVMLSDVAEPLLKMMGMSGSPEGAVSEAELAAALSRLETALAHHESMEAGHAEEERQQTADSGEDADKDDWEDDEESEPPVSLSTRAVPLLQMLRRARETGGYVMWRPK